MPTGKFQISNFKFQTSKRGFTLIELLIVVAIIAVLLGVGSVSFTTARRQGRDATRQADLEAVASALEQYFADNRSYPVGNGDGEIVCGDTPTAIAWGDPFTCDIGGETKVYLQELPEDPTGTPPYYYVSQNRSAGACTATASDCQQYYLEANLERAIDPLDIDCTLVTLNYCVDSPGFN